MLRLMVIDDELPARRGLKRLLQAHENVDIVGEASSLDEAQELAQVLRPDALFLDIDLGGDDGFALIDRLDPVPAIVFVTAHSTYAPQAFDVAAVDFLLKPVDEQRLALTLERLRHHRRSLQHAGRPSIGNEPKLAIQAKR
ncbi:MAG: LytR/AlgR family response regulator transcription factor, partial [Alphaproteobacteria bacterium]